MLAATTWQENIDTVSTRSAALVAIGLIAVLLAIVALASLFAPDISERAGSIVASVLGSFATVLAGLLLFLRVESVSNRTDQAVEKVEKVHHDILNGGLRENVKKAIRETEQEPEVRENRVRNVATGVSRDRHDKANRDAAASMRAQMEERVRRRTAGEDPPC